jgi:hypothetical protein
MSGVYKRSVNPFINPNPVYSHSYTWQYMTWSWTLIRFSQAEADSGENVLFQDTVLLKFGFADPTFLMITSWVWKTMCGVQCLPDVTTKLVAKLFVLQVCSYQTHLSLCQIISTQISHNSVQTNTTLSTCSQQRPHQTMRLLTVNLKQARNNSISVVKNS